MDVTQQCGLSRIVLLHFLRYLKNLTLLYSKEALLWKFIVAGTSKIYLGLCVKCKVLFPGCNQMRILSKIFRKSS
jgi:hypothetical protein